MSTGIMVASASGTAWELKKKGDDLLKRGDYSGAREIYQQSIELDPGWVSTWNNLESVYIHLGLMHEAEWCRAKKKELEEQQNADDLKNRGDELAKIGEFKVAVKYYQKAVELDPVNIPAWNNLGAAYNRIGRIDEARHARQQKRDLELLIGQKPEPAQTKVQANLKKDNEPWAEEPVKEKSSWGSRFKERLTGLSAGKKLNEPQEILEPAPPASPPKWDIPSPKSETERPSQKFTPDEPAPVSKWDKPSGVRRDAVPKEPSTDASKEVYPGPAGTPPSAGDVPFAGSKWDKPSPVRKDTPRKETPPLTPTPSVKEPAPQQPAAPGEDGGGSPVTVPDVQEPGQPSPVVRLPREVAPAVQKEPEPIEQPACEEFLTADELKRKADELAKTGNFSGAVIFYQRAVDLDPANIPAWRNMGASYRRLGRLDEAERCVARKNELEALAAGKPAPITQTPDRGEKEVPEPPQEALPTSEQIWKRLGGIIPKVKKEKAEPVPVVLPEPAPPVAGEEIKPASEPAVPSPLVPESIPDSAGPRTQEITHPIPEPQEIPIPFTGPTQEKRDRPEDHISAHDAKQKGDELVKSGDLEGAILFYQRAVELDPLFLAAWNNLGVSYHRLGRLEEAERCRAKKMELEGLIAKDQVSSLPHPGEPAEGGTKEASPGESILSNQFSEWMGGAQGTPAPGPAAVPKSPAPRPESRTPGTIGKSVVPKPTVQKIKIPSAWQKTSRPAAEPSPKVDAAKTTNIGSFRIFGKDVLKTKKRPEDLDNEIELKQEGDRLAKAGEYEAALGYYQRAISIDPSYQKAWNNLGYSYHHLGMLDEAEKCRARRMELASLNGQKILAVKEHAPFTLELGALKTGEEPAEKPSFFSGLKGLFPTGKKAAPEPTQQAADTISPSPKKTTVQLNAPTIQKESATMSASHLKPGDHAKSDHQAEYVSSATVEPKTSRFRTPKLFSKGGKKKKGKMLEEYNPAVHGNLVDEFIPEEFEPVDEYWIDEGRAHVRIMRNIETNQNEYLLFEPALSEFEYELLERLYEDLRDVLILNEEELTIDRRIVLFGAVQDLLNEYGLNLEDTTIFKLQYFIQRNFLGWLRIDALMRDPSIEDISCDGIGIPIFLYHRKYRNIKTNITFEEADLNSLAITLAQRSGKHISIGSPMIGATLPDGSRLQLSLGTEVTTRGTSFTIRKFREVPFTPIELMNFNTFNIDSLVYFWMAIENNKSLLFVGGTASGKTTSLNAVSLFIPPLAKIVSIEDTREITLYHENWIAAVTRESVSEGMGTTIMMFDLLKAAMRQRPEYIIVGEVRGVEAQTLFQAMNTGHTTFSTMHAGGVDAAIHRLESEPLNVPRNMIQALNIVSVQALIHREGERVRRCLEIVELAGIDPTTGNIQVNNVFEYDPVTDIFTFSERSLIYHDIMVFHGWTPEIFGKELGTRRKILAAMKEQDLTDYVIVSSIIQAFATERDKVLDNIDNLRAVLQ